MGKQWKQWQTLFLGAPKSLQMMIAAMKLKDTYSLEGVLTNLDSILKSRDITLSTKVWLCLGYGFSSSHVWMWELDYKESWAPKNWCFDLCCWRRLLREPWTERRSNQSILKEISLGYSLQGLLLKLKLQYFGHLMRRADSLEKTNPGKDWRQEEKGTTEDKMVGWHHQVNGHEFEQTPGDTEGQGILVCCSPWGHKELDTSEWLNNNNKI